MAVKRRFPGAKLKDLVAVISDVQLLPPDVVRLVARVGSKAAPLPSQVHIRASTAAVSVHVQRGSEASAGGPRVMSTPVATYESLVASRGPTGDVTSTSAPHQRSLVQPDNISVSVVDFHPATLLVAHAVPGESPYTSATYCHEPMGGPEEISPRLAPPLTLAELLLTPDPRGITVLDAGCSVATRIGGADALEEASLLGSMIDAPMTSDAEVLSCTLGTPVFLNVHEPFCFVTVGVQVCVEVVHLKFFVSATTSFSLDCVCDLRAGWRQVTHSQLCP